MMLHLFMPRQVNWNIELSQADTQFLQKKIRERNAPQIQVLRANILLLLGDGHSAIEAAKKLHVAESTVRKSFHKFHKVASVEEALDDDSRSGRPFVYTLEEQLAVVNEACKKPNDLGYAAETWTITAIAKHCTSDSLRHTVPWLTFQGARYR